MNDAERFDAAVKGIVGKRLMYDQLTGEIGDESSLASRPLRDDRGAANRSSGIRFQENG